MRSDAEIAQEVARLLAAFPPGAPAVACLALDGRMLAASATLYGLVGRTSAELSGVPLADLMHPDDRDGYRAALGRLREGSMSAIQFDSRLLHEDDLGIRAESQVWAATDPGSGDAEYLVAVIRDVTASRLAEEQSAELFGFPLALVFVAGLDGYFKRVGLGYQRLLGWTEQELLSRPFFEFVHPDDVATLGTALQEVAAGRSEVVNQEVRALCKDGTHRWLMGNYRPVLEEGLMYGMAIDITERKAVEEALERASREAEQQSRAKSEFLSGLSHELRTPLTAILGFAELIEFDDLGSRAAYNVEHILRAGRHLLQLIDELLDLARIEQGRVSLSIEPVRVDDVVREALEMLRPLASAANIRIWTEASHAPQHGRADRQRLKQVLMNLLSNAVKYNREGGTVTVACEPAPGGRVRVAVTDTGSGIPADMMERLFQPFDRLDAEGSGIEGTGIGLSLTKRLVELMDGQIGVESEVGRGSTFWVTLAQAEEPRASERAETAQAAAAPATGGAERTVLYVEDNIVNLQLLERILERRPAVRLLAAMQGQLAIELAREHHPDLILLDVHLPDIDGDEVLRRLRADPRTDAIPVVIVSGEASPANVERFRAAGARDYLTKPFTISRILEIVDATPARGDVESLPATTLEDDDGDPLRGDVVATLRELYNASPDDRLSDLAALFLRDTAERLADLRAAVEAGDAETTEALAHTLTGTSASMGARLLPGYCRRLEQLAGSKELTDAGRLVDAIEAEFQRVRRAVQHEFPPAA